jgi:hypothetical protein
MVTGITILLMSGTFVSFAETFRADLNRDGTVDSSDMAILHGEMGRENCSESACRGDINGDGRVNTDDVQILRDELRSSRSSPGSGAATADQLPIAPAQEDVQPGPGDELGEEPSLEPPADAAGEQETEEAPQPISTRFSDNKDGTITDTETGLMWTKNADLFGDTLLFHQAAGYIEDMNGGKYPNFGHSDWRLPTPAELKGLIDYTKIARAGYALPAGHPFDHVQPLDFNATSYLSRTDHSWFVSPYCRLVGHNVDSCYGHVWAVRGRGSRTAE